MLQLFLILDTVSTMYLIIASLTLVLTFVLYLRRNYGHLERLGIPVVSPYVLGIGSPPLWIHQKKMVDVDVERLERPGSVWGLYQGSDPWVFIGRDAKRTTKKSAKPCNFNFLTNQRPATEILTNGITWREIHFSFWTNQRTIKSLLASLYKYV